MKYLNLGCGNRFSPDWTNVNFTSTHPGVIAYNLTEGTPFPDNSFDVVYHSHLLEHFPKAQAPTFIQECYRVLRPQGVLRIAVPDLEQIIRSYIFALEQALDNSQEAANNYNWLLLELFDQVVRNHSGGEMIPYMHQENISNKNFIVKRLGTEARNIIESASQSSPPLPSDPWFKRLLRPVYHFLRDSSYRREVVLEKILSSNDFQFLQIGRFRQSGEVHQWMYDRYSLAQLLQQSGFQQIQQRSAAESAIPNWLSFNLDTEPDGSVYKPDSLYMEATKSA